MEAAQGYWDGWLRTTRVSGDEEDTQGDKIEGIRLARYNQKKKPPQIQQSHRENSYKSSGKQLPNALFTGEQGTNWLITMWGPEGGILK